MIMKKLRQYGKMAVLLPVATVRYLRKEKPQVLGLLGAAIVLLCICGASLAQVQENAVAPEPAVVSASPTPEPSPSPVTKTVTLTFAGDCTLGTDQNFSYSASFPAYYDQNGAAYFFQNVRDIFAADDLTVVNFEGTLTESTDRADKEWAFKGSRDYTEILTAGSVEAVNLANNHSSDYGPESFTDTQAALDAAEIAHFGFEDTLLLDVNGVQVGLMGMYTVYEDESYLQQLQDGIQTLQDQGAEIIVCSFHWGLERDYTPEADQVELAHAAIDAGATLVIGHHPHVLQGVEIYQGRYIVYSLGNFCFGGNSDPPDYDCMIFQQTFTVTDGVPAVDEDIQVIPCSVSSSSGSNNYQPTPATGEEYTRIWAKLDRISQDLGDKNIFATE
jgi:poly-gamma-glutamate synthesis protein (capsule biosynthesis protein)